MREIGIGILGFGTVGAGVVEGLIKNGDIMAERLGARPVLRKIADLDITSDRGVEVDKSILTTDAAAVIDDPGIDIIVELIGGCGIALDFVRKALSAGKAVVTANKKLLAEHGTELYELADKNNVDLCFEASVGGGIPIIKSLREALCANRINSIYGILNGTCNYILTKMETEGLAFDTVLKDAQEQGFAEADPGLDIDGFDTAHKAVILSSLACGHPVEMDAVGVEGIRGISSTDIKYALSMGYRIKLIALVRREASELEALVAPMLVPLDNMLASVNGVFNAVMVNSDLDDTTLYYGRGAGRLPTGSAVLGDICDIVRSRADGVACRMPAIPASGKRITLKPSAQIKSKYYLRIDTSEQETFDKCASLVAECGIAVESIEKYTESSCPGPTVVIITGMAEEKEIETAVEKIRALDIVSGDVVKLRVMPV